MCLPQEHAAMPLESGIMPLAVNDNNRMYVYAHGVGTKRPAAPPLNAEKKPKQTVKPSRIVLAPFANVYRPTDVCHPPVLMRNSSNSPVVPIYRERKVVPYDSAEKKDIDEPYSQAVSPSEEKVCSPDIAEFIGNDSETESLGDQRSDKDPSLDTPSPEPASEPTPAQSEKDSSPLWTAPTASPSPSSLDIASALLRAVDGGDAKFHSVFTVLSSQLISALKMLHVPVDFRFAFREFAGNLNLALKRFGPGSAEVDSAPPAENWILPFVIPWLHIDTPSDEHAIAFNDACEWICLLAGWTQAILNEPWNLIVEAMALPREDIAEWATSTALTILARCECRHDMICRTILLRHATMGFDEPQMAGFRMRRLRLLDFVTQKAAQEEAADSRSAIYELIHEFEAACCNEPNDEVRDAAVASLEKARYLQSNSLVLSSPSPSASQSFRECLSATSCPLELRSTDSKSLRRHYRWQKLKSIFRVRRKEVSNYEVPDNESAVSSDIEFPTARSIASGSLFRRFRDHMRLARNEVPNTTD